MTTTGIDLTTIEPIRRGDEADHLAMATYDHLIAVLDQLQQDDWARPTECTGWSVHDMVAHIVGSARGHASRRELVRQVLHGRRHKDRFDGNDLDAMNAHQVERNVRLSPQELVAQLRLLAPRAVRGRRRLPAPLRRIPLPMAPGGSFTPGMPTSICLGRLLDVILTRDVWLHRIDILRAVDREPDVDTDADRRIVADVAADWAGRHGQPVRLELTGPAGGSFVQGGSGPTLRLDAVEFCRVLSGRADGDGLLQTKVLF